MAHDGGRIGNAVHVIHDAVFASATRNAVATASNGAYYLSAPWKKAKENFFVARILANDIHGYLEPAWQIKLLL